jgi:hypothetical protein
LILEKFYGKKLNCSHEAAAPRSLV